jgi:uncharacterized protein (DUF362 family)
MSDVRSATQVAIAAGCDGYGEPPYSPAERFPEYPFRDSAAGTGRNPAYAGVREAFRLLGLDAERFGTPEWNPLGEVVRPGDTVVIKPNLVRDFRETKPGHDDCVITHGAVIRAVADYVEIALQGRGLIVVADAPHNDADFARVSDIAKLPTLVEFYRDHARVPLEVRDLRPEAARKVDGVIVGHDKLAGDPLGYVPVDLGADSMFATIGELCEKLYGSEYDMEELRRHHRGGRHAYLLSRTVLAADVVISLPKLKTHKKTGLTVNMKNLVGINGNKNLLPHHREGTPAQGGDQFPDDSVQNRLERSVVARFKQAFPLLGPLRPVIAGPIKAIGKRIFGDTNTNKIRSGNWYGNDTTWRMVIDLNRILFYADADGRVHDHPVRRLFSVVDGIVAGEGNGPMDCDAKPAGVVLAGRNSIAVDLAAARLMGFDYLRLPILREAIAPHARPLASFAYEDIFVRSNVAEFDRPLAEFEGPCLAFRPHFGWRGHVEVGADAGATAAVS